MLVCRCDARMRMEHSDQTGSRICQPCLNASSGTLSRLTSSTSLAHFMMCWKERSLVMSYTRKIPWTDVERRTNRNACFQSSSSGKKASHFYLFLKKKKTGSSFQLHYTSIKLREVEPLLKTKAEVTSDQDGNKNLGTLS